MEVTKYLYLYLILNIILLENTCNVYFFLSVLVIGHDKQIIPRLEDDLVN